MEFQKPTLNRGCLWDKFTALANARPVQNDFVNDVTIIVLTFVRVHSRLT